MSANECGSVANMTDIIRNCAVPSITGAEPYAVIMDYEDWLNATITEVDDITISAIALPLTKEAVEAAVPDNYTKPRYASEVSDSGDTLYTHGVQLLVDISKIGKKFAKESANGRYVIIVETKFKGTDKEDAFHVLGKDAGLKAAITYDVDANSGYQLVDFQSTAAEETSVPLTIFDTDYATTKATIQALLIPSS